ncbi:MAG: hypothetical protein U5L95_05655 [Candidatus Saccharibacteria bacterium]|nr:hypothetical protein [Candidatus Saccharibacteria bacterium]
MMYVVDNDPQRSPAQFQGEAVRNRIVERPEMTRGRAVGQDKDKK